jgi:Tol biopolymer transport system component
MQKDLTSEQETELYSDPDLTGVLRLSPDGRWLAFATDPSERGTGSLLIRSSQDGEVRELFKKPKEAFRIAGASWSPDSKYILFILAVKNPGEAQLWRVSPSGGDAARVWQTEKSIGGISIHPDGQKIAYSLYTQEFGIWAMEDYLAAIH